MKLNGLMNMVYKVEMAQKNGNWIRFIWRSFCWVDQEMDPISWKLHEINKKWSLNFNLSLLMV